MKDILETLTVISLNMLIIALGYSNHALMGYCRELRASVAECREALKRMEEKR